LSEPLGPDVSRSLRFDKLHVDPHLVATPLDAAFEHVAHIEIAAEFARVERLAAVGEGGVAPDHERASHPREVRRQALGDPVDEMLLLGNAADIRERQHDKREPRRLTPLWLGFRGGRCARGIGRERIDPYRPRDILEGLLAEIDEWLLQAVADLPIRVLRKANPARLADAFQSRGDIHTIAHQVAVALLDDVAEVDADAKLDALVGRDLGVALDHRPLDFNGAVHCVDDAAELDDAAVACSLDNAAMMHGYGRIDQVAAQRPEPG